MDGRGGWWVMAWQWHGMHISHMCSLKSIALDQGLEFISSSLTASFCLQWANGFCVQLRSMEEDTRPKQPRFLLCQCRPHMGELCACQCPCLMQHIWTYKLCCCSPTMLPEKKRGLLGKQRQKWQQEERKEPGLLWCRKQERLDFFLKSCPHLWEILGVTFPIVGCTHAIVPSLPLPCRQHAHLSMVKCVDMHHGMYKVNEDLTLLE